MFVIIKENEVRFEEFLTTENRAEADHVIQVDLEEDYDGLHLEAIHVKNRFGETIETQGFPVE